MNILPFFLELTKINIHVYIYTYIACVQRLGKILTIQRINPTIPNDAHLLYNKVNTTIRKFNARQFYIPYHCTHRVCACTCELQVDSN